jgi:hypothetical protein
MMENGTAEHEYYFCYSASLRIFGEIGDPSEITRRLGVEPTDCHRRGDRRSPRARPYQHDMWLYKAPIPEDRPLTEHLEALWQTLRPHVPVLKKLKERLNVDIFCGYRSNCETAGFEIDHRALVIFMELEVPLGVSVIVLED